MDDKPTVIIQKNFFQTIKGRLLILTLVITVLGGVTLGLKYFKFKTNFTSTPVAITLVPENFGFKAGDLTLDCPVDSNFCKSQKLIKIAKKDIVSYKTASGSAVINLSKLKSLDNIGILSNIKTQKKYFYESTISNDGKSCYTIAYTLPLDATFQNILDLGALNKKSGFAILGSQNLQVNNEESNVLIQVRNSPIDPGVPCSLIKKNPDFFKAF